MAQGIAVVTMDKSEQEAKILAEASAMLSGWGKRRLDPNPNIKAIRYGRTIGNERDVQADFLTVEAAIDRLDIRESVRYLIHVVARNRSENTFDNQSAVPRGQRDLRELELELLHVAESEVL